MFAEDQVALIVKWLQDSMAGMGTRDDDLIRLILSCAEVITISGSGFSTIATYCMAMRLNMVDTHFRYTQNLTLNSV